MNRPVSLAILLLAAACTPAPRPHAAVPQPLTCQEVEGLEPLLTPGSGLLLGEIHGTVESPAFVANAACLALRAGHPVTVVLEVPREEQARVDAFLASAGTEPDRAALLDSPFWTDAYQDGRRSQAMLALLDELRKLRQGGRPIRAQLIDRQDIGASTSQERDRWMAEGMAQAFDENPGGIVITLTGDVHSRITRGTPWVADFEPAAFLLATMKPELRLTALDISAPDGTAWTCSTNEVSSCQERKLRGKGDGRSGVVLHPQVTNGHHGIFSLGSLTASPPAVPQAGSAANPTQ
jgi:hypothetical protein